MNHKFDGPWNEIGLLQSDFLLDRGQTPQHYLLDLGCGFLRAGVQFVRYLQANHYFGIDISQALIDVGYEIELKRAGLQGKLSKDNLLCDDEFRAERVITKFDFVLAHSLFTHLPLNHIKLALVPLACGMKHETEFYATVFLCPPGHEWATPLYHEKGGITTFPTADPYHYHAVDLIALVGDLPFTLEVLGDWGHPRDQKMVVLRKVDKR